MEEFVASHADTASLMASLLDRAAARARVEHALVTTPVATPIQAAAADAPLFCEKGRASVSPLAPVAAGPAHRPRLWLRLSGAERRRVKIAAAFLGQSTAAFLRDALAVFMDNLLPLAGAPHIVARRVQQPSRERRVKLAFRVDAAVHAALHSAAAQRGETAQTLLTRSIDVHLARLIDSPAAKNLRSLLEAFDAVTGEHAGGAEVIDFPMHRRLVAPAPRPGRHAVR
jgi:hypothetical protein